MSDRIDEWVVMHLQDFQGKKLESVMRATVDLAGKIATADKLEQEKTFKDVVERVGKLLESHIESARLSTRLTESPSCLVAADNGMSRRLEKIYQQAGQKMPVTKPILELNADHPLMQRLRDTQDEESFRDLAELLYDQAVLTEGGQLEDPAGFVKRLNRLILAQGKSSIIL